jgi:hypothetical protein
MLMRGWKPMTVTVWILGVLVIAIAAYTYAYPRTHSVYPTYAAAATRWWAGQNLYDEPGYRYGPLFAIAMTPFALLPEAWGGALWKTLNSLTYAAGLWAWARRVLPVSLTGSQVAALFLLALPTSLMSMHNGQANLVMVGAMLLGLAGAVAGHWIRAAGWLALATVIKGYPLALPLLLVFLYPLRFGPRFAAALGLSILLPFATRPPGIAAAQSRAWMAHLRGGLGERPARFRSIDQLWRIYGHPLSPEAYAALGLFAGAAVLALCLLHARRTTEPREVLTRAFMLFAAWVILFGPTTEEATYVVIAPAIAWALVDAFRRPAGRGTRLLLIASLLLMGPLGTDTFGTAVRLFATGHGSLPFGGLLFFTYLLAQTGRTHGERGITPGASPSPSTHPPTTR